ncbi:MAG: phosphate-starvation-inducible PsiE family protein [Xanthobacteraceae bacterium]
MSDFENLKKRWKDTTPYGLFERITSLVVMFFVSIIIVYSLILMAIDLYEQFGLGVAFMESESLRDVFGSILTILILIEFNHSIAVAISTKSGILQARPIVLITILVIARKVILLDFNTATFEKMLAISAMAVAFGLLYWLMMDRPSDPPADAKFPH